MDKFKKGELCAVMDYSPTKERDIKRRVFVRFRDKDGQYYCEFLKSDKGYEYLGTNEEWFEEDNLIKLKGEIITEMRIRAEDLKGNLLSKRKLYSLKEIEKIKEVEKRCDCDKSKKDCNCIIPTFLTTFKDGKQIVIFDYDAKLISYLNGLDIIKTNGLNKWF